LSRPSLAVLLTLGLVGMLGLFVYIVLRPAWQMPQNGTYTSRFGRAAVIRGSGDAFRVSTALAARRGLKRVYHGEGLMESDAVLVPAIPMARIAAVDVVVGQHVVAGQRLAILDDSLLLIRIQAVDAAIEIAEAEAERTRIGSAYTLAQERPVRDAIALDACRAWAEIAEDRLGVYERLQAEGLVSLEKVLSMREVTLAASADLRLAEWALNTSKEGHAYSMEIAEQAVEEARLAHRHLLEEKQNYVITAPVAGIVERVLIRAGEYNQDPGRPCFVVSSGLWFSAHLDQGAISRVDEGADAEVILEAFPGRTFAGEVAKVVPFVTFNLGGPETNRPIRPQGTGAPEWPATFKLEVALDEFDEGIGAVGERLLVPGLTGFARVSSRTVGIAVPRAALLSLSSSKALVFVVEGDEWDAHEVTLGLFDGDWVEIVDGLSEGDQVMVSGHQVLEVGDRIEVVYDRSGD
jgi:HlyD family secretion protein